MSVAATPAKRSDVLAAAKVAVRRAIAFVRPPRDQQLTLQAIVGDQQARSVLEQFHRLWYASEGAQQVRWLGHPVLKSPFDLWTYQDILYTCRPDVIIETGTHHGGSALFFSTIGKVAGLDLDVLTIDFNPKIAYDAAAGRIIPIAGISTTTATVEKVRRHLDMRRQRGEPKVMVVLDSDHSQENVLRELEVYAPLVTPGQYLVVEDTNVNGHPVLPEHGPGPYEAVQQFLAGTSDFEFDPQCERFLFTQNPGGWLRRR